MAADALNVDIITATAPIAAAERIFLSIFTCLHAPFARRAKHLGVPFGSGPGRKFSADAGVAPVSHHGTCEMNQFQPRATLPPARAVVYESFAAELAGVGGGVVG
jgi:hypothetical protein